MDLRDRLQLDHPIVQAGMGGGIGGARLAAAVSRAGALGTVGIGPPGAMAGQLRAARAQAPGRPVAANLLMPFARRAHVQACIAGGASAVSLFFGFDPRVVAALRAAGILVLHQVGTPEEARRALADGADVLVAQGVEAGGHLLGTEPLRDALPRILDVAGGAPVLAAGGMATAADTRAALGAGAAAVVAGSRFLLTDECAAHPEYKRRALAAPRTIVTKLFGLGWPDRHRVVPNRATERWDASAAVAALNASSRAMAKVLPMGVAARMTGTQRVALPLFGPGAALEGMPGRLVEATPLYAGECVRRIDRIVPAAEAVRSLAP